MEPPAIRNARAVFHGVKFDVEDLEVVTDAHDLIFEGHDHLDAAQPGRQ